MKISANILLEFKQKGGENDIHCQAENTIRSTRQGCTDRRYCPRTGRIESSQFIRFLQRSRWSHSAIVVRGKDIDLEGFEGQVLLWESNLYTEGVNDVVLKKPKDGPQLVLMVDRIKQTLQPDRTAVSPSGICMRREQKRCLKY